MSSFALDLRAALLALSEVCDRHQQERPKLLFSDAALSQLEKDLEDWTVWVPSVPRPKGREFMGFEIQSEK